MRSNLTITVAMIVLNEERNLAELLPALDWADELVLVDGGSHDATVRIARSHGCRVVLRRFDTFAAQRNRTLELARGDWVFSIDADERPTPRLAAEIRRRITSGPGVSPPSAGTAKPLTGKPLAFRVPIRSSIFGRPIRRCGTQDDCPVRLFRRGAARWVGDVHEVLRVSGRVGRLENWLTHRPLPDLETFLAKMHRYTLLEAKAQAAADDSQRDCSNLPPMGRRPSWHHTWIAPPCEVFRRLIYKQGFLDGPAGWAFCFLSGLSQWVLAREHRRLLSKGRPMNNFGISGGWRLSEAKPQDATSWGTVALCPSHPSSKPGSYLSAAPKEETGRCRKAIAKNR